MGLISTREYPGGFPLQATRGTLLVQSVVLLAVQGEAQAEIVESTSRRLLVLDQRDVEALRGELRAMPPIPAEFPIVAMHAELLLVQVGRVEKPTPDLRAREELKPTLPEAGVAEAGVEHIRPEAQEAGHGCV